MSVGITCPFVMDGKVSAHSSVHKIVLDEGTDKGKLLRPGQLHRQGYFDFSGKLGGAGLLDFLHAVPEGGAVCKLWRGVGGQHDFRMDNTGFMRVITGQAVPFAGQFFAAPVGGSGNSRTAHAPLDDLNGTVKNCYVVFLLPPQSTAGDNRPAETEQTQSGCSVFAGAHGVWGRYFPIASARTQQPPAGRTTPDTVYKCAVRNGL